MDPLWVAILAKQAEIRYYLLGKQKPVLLKRVCVYWLLVLGRYRCPPRLSVSPIFVVSE
jgi:hypothetical protein